MNSLKFRVLSSAFIVATTVIGFAPNASAQIEEIVVTTRKRAENLQDVPIAITAITADTITRRGISTIEDLTKVTTGINLDEGLSKQDTRIMIRGLSPTRGRQNVAVLMDDVDLSSEAISSAGGSFFIIPRLFDVERIDVVKGPQSALFGRSAFAGAINYITRKPGDKFEASVGADFGSYGKQEGRLSVSGPVVEDKLSVGVTGAAWNFNGFYKSATTNANVGGFDGRGGAAAAVFKPNDILKFSVRAEYSKDHFDIEARTYIAPSIFTLNLPSSAVNQGIPNIPVGSTTVVSPYLGEIPKASALPPVRQSRNPRTDRDYPGTDRTIKSVTLRSEADFTDVQLVSITHYGAAYATQFLDNLVEGDYTTVNSIQETHFVTDNRMTSEDLRLQSNNPSSRLTWTLGGLFWNEKTVQDGLSNACISTAGGCGPILAGLGVSRPSFLPTANVYKRNTHHYSIYGIAAFKITDDLTVEAQFRHAWEAEHITAPTNSILIGCVGGQRTVVAGVIRCLVPAPQVQTPTVTGYGSTATGSQFWTPRATVNYKLNPDLMVYVSAANGKKPGGSLSLISPTLLANGTVDFSSTKFLQESLWVYEVGTKAEFFDKRLRVNADGYYQDFKNKQESGTRTGPDGLPLAGPGNAKKARVWGLEADVAYVVNNNLTLTGSYSYADAKYVEFTLQQTTAANIALAGNCTVVRPATGTPFCSVSYAGKALVLSPKHNFNLGGAWKQNLSGDLDWTVEIDTKYVGKRFTSFDNSTWLGSYWTADARVGVQAPKWSIVGYVTNLFDDDTLKAGTVNLPDFNTGFISGGVTPQNPGLVSGTLASLPDKRQFGVRVNYSF